MNPLDAWREAVKRIEQRRQRRLNVTTARNIGIIDEDEYQRLMRELRAEEDAEEEKRPK